MATIPKLPVLLLMTTMLGGCSLLIMRGVDSKWDGTTDPKCSEYYQPVYGDAVLSSIGAATAVGVAQMDLPLPNTDIIIAGSVVTSLLFTTSALIGASRYKECLKAKARLYVHEALGGERPDTDVQPTDPQGYFCTYSPSQPDLYTCVREHGACEQVRKALAISDGAACMPRKRAWCFDINRASRCFGTQYACEERRSASVAKASSCGERP